MNFSAAFLRGILTYDPLTGIFVWNTRFDVSEWWNGRYAGKVTGSLDAHGYLTICINGKNYKSHRLAWIYITGQALSSDIEIDHRDGNRANNRFSNLRLANDYQNAHNTKIRRDNSSGVKGVCWKRAVGKWCAQINMHGVRHSLGYFDNLEAARAAYQSRAAQLHGEFMRAL